MSLFVKHIADKQLWIPCHNSLFFSDATASSHAISVKAFRWRIWEKKLARTTWPETHQRRIMRPTDKATTDSRSVQSFAIIKNTGHGNCFTLAVFTLELEMDYPTETSLCTVNPSPTDTPSPFLLLRGGGRLYTGYLKWLIHLQLNCPSKLTEKARRIVLIQN